MRPNEHFPYVARTPDHMAPGLPIIFQLHGAGECGDGTNLEDVEIHGFSHIFSIEQDIACILIEPQCPRKSFWVAQIPFLVDFIQRKIAEYHCDESRVYLTGLSMGGYGTWYTAMAYPELFSAIAPCCGGGMPWNPIP